MPRAEAAWADRLGRRVDARSVAVVRIVFGLVGVLSAARLLRYGWVDALYAEPARHFTYPFLDWVRPLPGAGMQAVVVVMGVAAAGVALGWRYRASMAVFWVSFAWIELIDVTTYLNHYWFLSVTGLVLLVSPMAAAWSLDARRAHRGLAGAAPPTVPVGTVWLLRFQVAVVYVFAGLAKVDVDWLAHALPLRLWLPVHADVAVLGPVFADTRTAFALSWAGAAFDLLVVWGLLWRRTRPLAWAAVVGFHVATWLLFPIGVFPWLMIGATTIFFEPDWPARASAAARRRFGSPPAGVAPVEVAAMAEPAAPAGVRRVRRAVVVVGLVWVAAQVLLPLRSHLYPGDPRWTGEGYRFSWNVLLTERSGMVTFRVTDPLTGRTRTTSAEHLYTPLQWRTMATDAELIRQAAHAVHDDPVNEGRDVEVRVDAFVSLNGRPARRLVDPDADLAHEPARLTPQPWILRDPPPT